jgi:hypothetical protein
VSRGGGDGHVFRVCIRVGNVCVFIQNVCGVDAVGVLGSVVEMF